MRQIAALTLSAALTLGAAITPAIAQDNEALAPTIERCLRDNAAKVEAAEPDVTKAVDFLVSYVCAGPVAQERNRQTMARSRQLAEQNQANCKQRAALRKTPPPNGMVEDCGVFMRNLNNVASPLDILGMSIQLRPPAATALAAQLILDLRLAHTKSRP